MTVFDPWILLLLLHLYKVEEPLKGALLLYDNGGEGGIRTLATDLRSAELLSRKPLSAAQPPLHIQLSPSTSPENF